MNIQTLLHDQNRFIITSLQEFVDDCNKPLNKSRMLDISKVIEIIRFHIQLEKKYLYSILRQNPSLSPLLDKMAREHQTLLNLMDRINMSHIDEPFLIDKTNELLEKFKTHANEDQKTFFAHACDSLSGEQCDAMIKEINEKMTDDLLRHLTPVS